MESILLFNEWNNNGRTLRITKVVYNKTYYKEDKNNGWNH